MTDLLVVMGVAGTGKTTVGRLVAERLGRVFLEGDDFHPDDNRARMAAGQALTNADRRVWIAAIGAAFTALGKPAVLACSALNPQVRDWLASDCACEPAYALLHGPADIIRARLEARSGHYMRAGMLDSQMAALDPPADVATFDIRETPDAIATAIAHWMSGTQIPANCRAPHT